MDDKDICNKIECLYEKNSSSNLESVTDTYLELLNHFSLNHRNLLAKCICKKILGETNIVWDVDGKIYDFLFIENPTHVKYGVNYREFKYFAKHVLHALDNQTENIGEPKEGMFSIADYLEICLRGNSMLWYPRQYSQIFFYDVASEFFRSIRDNFECNVSSITYAIYAGVPFYKKKQGTEDFYLVDDLDREYIYLQERGRYGDLVRCYEAPNWATYCYINAAHIQKHYLFDNPESEPSEIERVILVSCFRKLIDVPNVRVDVDSYGSGSKLYKIMQHVISRYYGDNFDVNDSDTLATQKDVIEWLKTEYYLSEREATAIDIVTRPDEARRR